MSKHSYEAPASAVSPAGEVMSEAIDLAIEERSPFPERSFFLDADVPLARREPVMKRAAREGASVVLVFTDRSTHVISPREILDPKTADSA